MARKNGPLWSTYQDLKSGRITRREFIARATALGVALPVTLFVLNSAKLETVAAQDSNTLPAGRPSVGTEGQTRGAGGELKMLQWQAASLAFLHRAQGTKDQLSSSLVSEPLLSYAPDGTLIPTLATEVPTLENGGLSEDLKTITINLLEGVLWSDGEPFTADDVVFTWQWIMEPSNSAVTQTTWGVIDSVEAVTPTQVKFTMKESSLAWFVPIAGSYYGSIIPKHAWDGKDAATVNTEFLTNPIGTGPYKIDSFKENDQIIYSINENYREPNKPYFATVNLKGGGEASSAAQAVLQTGDWHFAWNMQVEPDILRQLEESGGKGTVIAAPPTNTERVMFNFSDPRTEVDGERSNLNAPHPFLTDVKVREAFSLATDRESIANQFYLGGDQEPPGRNFLTALAGMDSPNTSWEFDLEKAKATLEEAGWVLDGDVRTKDGMELSVSYFTSINSVRQKTQAVNKKNWEDAGIKVQLGQVTSDVFFSSAPGNDQTYAHNYRDIQMFTSGPVSPYPLTHMQDYYAGPDNVNVAQKSNEWSGTNNQRYINPDYDALYEQAQTATDMEAAADIFIQMNDILINDFVLIPVVSRAAEKEAISNQLVADNIAVSGWEPAYWNIANWTFAEQ
jgi:peptide/nickel transport system substrate-binding protein